MVPQNGPHSVFSGVIITFIAATICKISVAYTLFCDELQVHDEMLAGYWGEGVKDLEDRYQDPKYAISYSNSCR